MNKSIILTRDIIETLSWYERVRMRPEMYIGKRGNGDYPNDGIYLMLKWAIENSIYEYECGFGKLIEITVDAGIVTVRDYGRGVDFIDLEHILLIGLNGGGMRDDSVPWHDLAIINALSVYTEMHCYYEGEVKKIILSRGKVIECFPPKATEQSDGTFMKFIPDPEIFPGYKFNDKHIYMLLRNHLLHRADLLMDYNGNKFHLRNGLADILKDRMTHTPLYPIIHLQGDDIEVAITHTSQYEDEYYSFVNGHYTPQGGTHLYAFKKSLLRIIEKYYGEKIRQANKKATIGLVAAISIKLRSPFFEPYVIETKLASRNKDDFSELTIEKFVSDFLKKELCEYLNKNGDTADTLLMKINEVRSCYVMLGKL